ncbi:MAG: SPOR domain-containing protein [Tannerellaceae bacterium]|nr:SPOR domain-containing protein [Tannerellaceae bacterium]
MLRLISHIERLLRVHDCVIVPGIGGFVGQIVAASYDAEKHLFSPVHKEVVFNASLHHNDGLLTESYMKTYQVDFNDAFRMVQEDVEHMNCFLKEHSFLRLGSIGKLSISADNTIVFEGGGFFSDNMLSYGLIPLQMKTLQVLQQEEAERILALQKEADTTHYLPIVRRVIQGVVAAAATVALFFLVSPSVNEVDQSRYQNAGWNPIELLTTNSVRHEVSPEENSPEDVFTPVTEVIEPVVVSEQPTPEVATPKPNQKMYYIVIGSFVTNKQADDFVQKIQPHTFPFLERIERNERIRVYANKFDNRTEAEDYLDTLRQTTRFHDAWLFISR